MDFVAAVARRHERDAHALVSGSRNGHGNGIESRHHPATTSAASPAVSARSVSFAKTTRPSLAGIIARTRLFERLDGALGSPAIWITGPSGRGKTALC